VVTSCLRRRKKPSGMLEAFLDRMGQTDDWRNVVAAIRRILDGERDMQALRAGLDTTGYVIVHTILAQLLDFTSSHTSRSRSEGARQLAQATEAEAAAQLRRQWAPVVQAVVAACRGDAAAAAQLEPLLAQFSKQDDWRHLAAALRRILTGERDPAALLPGLDANDTLIASDVLRALGVDLTGFRNLSGLSLDDLLGVVALACTPDAPPGLAEQLHAATRTLAADPNAPAEIRALGRALNAVLSGDRAPDLSALPPELADKVWGMLGALKGE